MTNGSAVASRLQFENFERVVGAEFEKSEFVKIDWGRYFLSLTVSGYYIITVSKSVGRSKKPTSGFRHSGRSRSTDFRSESGVEKLTNRKHLKSYINPPENIGLLPFHHEQFKFYVPQHGRALVPCIFVRCQIRLLVPKLVYPPIFRSIRLQLLVKLLFQFKC